MSNARRTSTESGFYCNSKTRPRLWTAVSIELSEVRYNWQLSIDGRRYHIDFTNSKPRAKLNAHPIPNLRSHPCFPILFPLISQISWSFNFLRWLLWWLLKRWLQLCFNHHFIVRLRLHVKGVLFWALICCVIFRALQHHTLNLTQLLFDLLFLFF